MECQHVKRILDSPFFVNFKKYKCPVCGKLLSKTTVSKIVNSNSLEAEKYDFSSVDGYIIGNVKFIWTELRCNACDRNYPIKEIKHREKTSNIN